MSEPVPEDITEQLRAQGHLVGEHENAEDRVYRLGEDLVKVKVFLEKHATPVQLPTGHTLAPVVMTFRFSGAMVGEDGKALRIGDDIPAVFGFGDQLVIQHDAKNVNLPVEIEVKRLRCVHDTVRAYQLHREAAHLVGVAERIGRDA